MITPDVKDWTWVLERPCAACGYDAASVAPHQIAPLVRANRDAWLRVLARPEDAVRRRPRPDVWSPLEYACHVRDVHEVFAGRVRRMLAEDAPAFANWDQDATAVEREYAADDPARVATALAAGAERLAALYDGMDDEDRARPGLRSDGSAFTLASLGLYLLHDLEHHLVDVGEPRAGARAEGAPA
ncbi:DinB family protein [Nocardioides sp. TRM66260-LWL]|uniref:DinB family protein n=1 Tax=Nocardioides sp. TRM66260-LWL TaxID=2874478 RepID=UPI0035B1E46B